MSVLYVTQPGALVRKKGARLRVEWNGQVLATLPLQAVERLVLLGPVQVSAAATGALLRARTPVVFCNQHGTCYGQLSIGCEDIELLLIHVARYYDLPFRLSLARTIVDAKICHQQRLLRRHARNHPNPVLDEAADKLDYLRTTLPRRSTVAEVMGVEGLASALYFSVFGKCLRQEGVSFSERSRRPPRDPVNAILSLGYTLVLTEVLAAVMAQGLHPGLGFLHEVSRRRPALALDMLELARQPIVDRLTLSLFNRSVLTPKDFHTRTGGEARLKEASLKRYLTYYERTMTTPFRYGSGGSTGTFRDWLRVEVETLKKAVAGAQAWSPITLEL